MRNRSHSRKTAVKVSRKTSLKARSEAERKEPAVPMQMIQSEKAGIVRKLMKWLKPNWKGK